MSSSTYIYNTLGYDRKIVLLLSFLLFAATAKTWWQLKVSVFTSLCCSFVGMRYHTWSTRLKCLVLSIWDRLPCLCCESDWVFIDFMALLAAMTRKLNKNAFTNKILLQNYYIQLVTIAQYVKWYPCISYLYMSSNMCVRISVLVYLALGML